MSLYDCPRLDDAGGYVLRALPEGEWESYRYHLDECDQCTSKVTELGFVSHALLSAVAQLSAPPDVRGRVMSVVRAESELLLATGATADRPVRQRSRGFGFARLHPAMTGALATVLLALGLGIGLLAHGSSSVPCTTHSATVNSPGGHGQLQVCGGSGRLALVGMPRPPAGRAYELWLDDPSSDQRPKRIAEPLFFVQDGKASVDVGKVGRHQRVLVTDEAQPDGSSVPTGTVVATAST